MKSNIKSKKQKMNQKKFSKGNTPHLIDLIQSSSQPFVQVEKIQKKSKYSGMSINNRNNGSTEQIKIQPNILNIQNLKKAVIDNKFLAEKALNNNQNNQSFKKEKTNNNNSDSLLVVQSNFGESQGSIQDRSLFSYKVQGKQGIKYISQSHFKGRINAQIKDLQLKALKKIYQQEQQLQKIMQGQYPSSDQDKKNQQNKKPQQKQRKRAARYFEQQNSDQDDEDNKKIVKCFRCNKKGHIAKNCMDQQPKIQCNFCLGQHHHSLCDSSPCFKCCQSGHISQDCSSKGIQCRKCHKRGHRGDYCGVFLYLDYHHRTQDQIKKKFNIHDLRNLKCMNSLCKNRNGHFNCFTYTSNKNLLPYQDQEKKYNSFNQRSQREYQFQNQHNNKFYRSQNRNNYNSNNQYSRQESNYYQKNSR